MLIKTGYAILLHGFNLMNYDRVSEEGFLQTDQFRYNQIQPKVIDLRLCSYFPGTRT